LSLVIYMYINKVIETINQNIFKALNVGSSIVLGNKKGKIKKTKIANNFI